MTKKRKQTKKVSPPQKQPKPSAPQEHPAHKSSDEDHRRRVRVEDVSDDEDDVRASSPVDEPEEDAEAQLSA